MRSFPGSTAAAPRRRSPRLAWACLAAACTVWPALPATAQPAAASREATLARDVDRLLERWDTTSLPGCTVGVSLKGETVLSRAYGMADLEHAIANRPDTIIEAGSVSKQFTAAAVLLLAQAGTVSLDAPVRTYLPELPDPGGAVTVRQMLLHTSGLRDWGNLQDIAGWPRTTRTYTHAHVLDIAARQRALNHAPGEDFAYTNTGYNLAAMLVERVSGRSFYEFSRTEIFEPLGMTRTSWRDDHTRIVRDRASGYTVDADGVRLNMPFENVFGNGGLLTTVGDLLKWNENAVRASLGGPAFVEAQHTRGRLNDGREIVYTPGAVYVQQWRGVNEVSHSGGTAGYRAWLARYPDQRLSVAVLCNASDAPAWTIGRQIAELYLGLPAPPQPGAATLDKAVLDQVAGVYRSRRTSAALAITAVEGRLQVPGFGALTPTGPDAFQLGAGTARLEVERDATGRVVGARATASGETTRYERVDVRPPTPADLQAFSGTYVSDEAEVSLTVAVVEGKLVLRRRPNTTIALEPVYADAFTGSIGTLRFMRDAKGTVTEMSLGRDRVWDLRFRKVVEPARPPQPRR